MQGSVLGGGCSNCWEMAERQEQQAAKTECLPRHANPALQYGSARK